VTDTDSPPFVSTESAVRFALNRDGSPAQPLFTKMLSEGAMRITRGWSAIDAATQAGLILCALRQIQRVKFSTLVAKSSPATLPCSCRSACCSGRKINFQWREALGELAIESHSIVDATLPVRRALLVKIYGRGYTHLTKIAKEFNEELDTVTVQHRQLIRWLYGARGKNIEGLEPSAWREADGILRTVGIVGDG
jgi:hypothetical protein